MRFKKTVHPKPYETTSRHICDRCGADCMNRGYDGTEVTISARVGMVYPEGDSRQTQQTDCCEQCWREIVRPALEKAGFKFHEWDTEEGPRMAEFPFDPRET